jgi:hypothetical protein
MKLPIYHYRDKCLRRKKEIDLCYPEELAFRHGIGNVEETFRNTQGRKIIGNVCPYCNAFQDHWFVEHSFILRCNDSNLGDSCVWVDEDLKCDTCGASLDYEIRKNESLDIIQFYQGSWGRKCLSCMNEEDAEFLVDRIYEMTRCAVCDRLIFDTQDFSENITIDDTTIVRSKPNKHHVNYEKNKVMIICSECHMKIHNSMKKKYREYRPVD